MGNLKLDLFAGCLNQFAELYTGGAGGFAGTTAQAAIHVIHKLWRNFHAPLGNCLHLVNSSAWGIHFYSQHRVSWACGQAEAAVNALAH